MSKEVISKQTVLDIIKQNYEFHDREKNSFTASVLVALHNTFVAIEGVQMTDCDDCEYFQTYKENKNE